MSPSRVRTYVLTGAVAAITATGAWYGAGLKAQQEFTHEVRAAREATIDERIEQLNLTRSRLVRQRNELQGKIEQLSSKNGSNTGDLDTPAG